MKWWSRRSALLTFKGAHAAKVDAGDVSDRTHVAGQREFAAVSEVLLLDAREPRDELRRNFTCWFGCQVRCLEVLVSAVSASSWRFRDAGRVHEPSIFSHPLKSSVTRAVHLASG